MYVILVYDTAAERNPAVLRTCRRYLHHVQRSVFEGSLSTAQVRRLEHDLRAVTDPTYDSILVYTYPPGADPQRRHWGLLQETPSDIL